MLIEEIINKIELENNIAEIKNKEEQESFRIKFLSKNGLINQLFDEFKKTNSEEKKILGKTINELKQKLENKYKSFVDIKEKNQEKNEDYTKQSNYLLQGSKHPITLVKNEIIEIFSKIGFDISDGPEIEDDWHNFTALNFPPNHPARDMQDTFFITEEYALRTHTSSVQVRLMENNQPPIRSISPGRVYRNEAVSARSNCFFHQIEGLYIDKEVSFVDLKQTLYYFVSQYFGEREIRFRASYFPFTEISAEMDIFLDTKTEEDYRLTKGTGWLEIMGCGMVDPNVLINCNINPVTYSGFAFGMGLDRIAMLKYGIKDIRNMYYNDIRLLKQTNFL